MQTVTPYLLYADGAVAIDWLTRAFGSREVERSTGAAGGCTPRWRPRPAAARRA